MKYIIITSRQSSGILWRLPPNQGIAEEDIHHRMKMWDRHLTWKEGEKKGVSKITCSVKEWVNENLPGWTTKKSKTCYKNNI